MLFLPIIFGLMTTLAAVFLYDDGAVLYALSTMRRGGYTSASSDAPPTGTDCTANQENGQDPYGTGYTLDFNGGSPGDSQLPSPFPPTPTLMLGTPLLLPNPVVLEPRLVNVAKNYLRDVNSTCSTVMEASRPLQCPLAGHTNTGSPISSIQNRRFHTLQDVKLAVLEFCQENINILCTSYSHCGLSARKLTQLAR